MRHSILTFLGILLIYSPSVMASEAAINLVPNASIVGHGILSYAFWDVYEATLYAPKGQFKPTKPFALSIKYFYEINGKDIADKSVQEMRRQGFNDEIKLAAWHTQLKAIFPNVKTGTVLSAVFTPDGQTYFFNGSKAIGTIKGGDFARLFFGIWLSETTSKPELRRNLLGLS